MSSLAGAEGDVDTTFGTDGLVRRNLVELNGIEGVINGEASAVRQSDGKIVAVIGSESNAGASEGDIALARFNADGSLDTSFADQGRLRWDLGGDETPKSVALQSDGTIIIGGETSRQMFLVAVSPNGRPVTSFGSDGVVIRRITKGDAWLHEVLIDPDDNILVLGQDNVGTPADHPLAILRFAPDGAVDEDFGVRLFSPSDRDDTDDHSGVDLAITSDEDYRIYFCGYFEDKHSPTNGSNLAQIFGLVGALNRDGTPVTDFGDNGMVIADFFADQHSTTMFHGLAPMPDGGVMVVGQSSDNPDGLEFAAWGVTLIMGRYDDEGNLVTTFGDQGVVYEEDINNAVRPESECGRIFLRGGGAADIYHGNGILSVDIDTGAILSIIDDDTPGGLPFYGSAEYDFRVEAHGVIVDGDDFILVGNTSVTSNDIGEADLAIMRVRRDGTVAAFADGEPIAHTFVPLKAADEPLAITIDQAGRIVMSGIAAAQNKYQAGVLRLLSDGRVDNSFGPFAGSDGWYWPRYDAGAQDTAYDSWPRALAALEGDRVLVAGHYERTRRPDNHGVGLAVIGDNGQPDSTVLNGSGRLGVDFNAGSGSSYFFGAYSASGVTVDGRDGYLVTGAYSTAYTTSNYHEMQMMVARFDTDGSLDENFGGGDGVWLRDHATGGNDHEGDGLFAHVLAADDGIVAAGSLGERPANAKAILLKLQADGSDPVDSFGSNGQTLVDPGSGGDRFLDVTSRPGGGFIAVGYANRASNNNRAMLIASFDADGNPDTAFASDGVLVVDAGGSVEEATSVAMRDSGAILVAGRSDDRPIILQIATDGTLQWQRIHDISGLTGAVDMAVTDDDSRAILACAFDNDLAALAITLARPGGQPAAPVIAQGGDVSLETLVDDPVGYDLSATDADTAAGNLAWAVGDQPSSGGVSLSTSSGGATRFTYQPAQAFTGVDEFSVVVSDGSRTDSIAVRVIVSDAPPIPRHIRLDVPGQSGVDVSLVPGVWESAGHTFTHPSNRTDARLQLRDLSLTN